MYSASNRERRTNRTSEGSKFKSDNRTLRSMVVPTFRNYLFIKKHKFSIGIYDGPRTRSLTKRSFSFGRCGPGDGRRSGPARARPWTLRDLAPMPGGGGCRVVHRGALWRLEDGWRGVRPVTAMSIAHHDSDWACARPAGCGASASACRSRSTPISTSPPSAVEAVGGAAYDGVSLAATDGDADEALVVATLG